MSKKHIIIGIIILAIILYWGYKTMGWFTMGQKYRVNTAFTASKPRNGTMTGPTKDFKPGDILVLHTEKDVRGDTIQVTADGWDVTGYVSDFTKL